MQQQARHYSQLSEDQRYQISALFKLGTVMREIARIVGVNASTVSRELKRNANAAQYIPDKAHKQCMTRKSKAHKATKVTKELINHIKKQFECITTRSLHNMSSALACEGSPLSVSVPTLYRCIALDKARGGKLYQSLPFYGHYRKPGGKRKLAGASCIPNRVDISERPDIVEKRSRLGDWEGDLVCGPNGCLVTLVERKSRQLLVKKVFDKTKETVARAIIELFSTVKHTHTLTLDNGGEFAMHQHITAKTGVNIYFAKPHCSWQRGSNENMNGWIRRYYPKKTRLGSVPKADIEKMVNEINNAPRRVLNGLSPNTVFYA